MKFLCDQCKAKYQIADEKVQGKTLRMKCRKCGHVIEIRATDSNAGATGDTMQVDALNAEQAIAALDKAKAQPAAPARPSGAKPTPAPPGARPGAPTRLSAAIAPAKGAPPRPVAGPTPKPGTAAPRPGAVAPRPGANRPSEAGKDSSALSSAFSKNLIAQKKPEPAPVSTAHHADTPPEEWYAAIDEVPVGPIRLTDLRQKYAQGAVTDDSLVWREGFEEWRPLRTLPDLFQLVREEVSGAFHPPGARNSLLPAGTGHQAPKRTSGPAVTNARASSRPQATPAAAPVAARGNVIPFSPSRGAVAARKLEEEFDDEATQIASAPLILPAPTAAAAAKVESDPFARHAPVAAAPTAPVAPTPAPAPVSVEPIGGLEGAERLTMLDRISVRARGISKGTVVLIAAACVLLGVVIAVMMVKPKIVERVVEKRVEVPVSVNVPVPMGGPVATASAEPSAEPGKVASKGGTAAPKATAPTATATANGGSTSLKGLDMGPAGPSLGGPDPGGPPVPGMTGQLSGKDVESVVNSKRIGVRKQCYEPYADKGDATVTLTLGVGPSGSVDSSTITNSSGPAASLVGPCIQKMGKTWHFPASGTGGNFAIPFIFKAG